MNTPPGRDNLIYTKEEPNHSLYIVDRSGVTLRQDGLPGETRATWLVLPFQNQRDRGHIVHLQTLKQLTLLLHTQDTIKTPRDVVIRGELTDEEGRKCQTWIFTEDGGEWTIKSLFDETSTIVTRKENPFPENQNVTITSTVGADHHSKWTFVRTKPSS